MNPLTDNLTELTDDKLQERINTLYTRLNIAGNLGKLALYQQVLSTLNEHREEYTRRMAEKWNANKNSRYFKDKVDVSKKKP